MSVMWFGDLDGVPLDEAKVRATTAPVIVDAPPAEAVDAPEFNEFESDQNPNLGGLSFRNLASDWHESEQYAPFWADNATRQHDIIINEQVAKSGTAAAREMSGQFGHGTMAYAVGIEPTIRSGGAFGNDYFAANKADINELSAETAGRRGVTPTPGRDREQIAGAAAYGGQAARKASNSAYGAFLGRD